jgi:ATP-dependent protease HslVU (ClpYQ) peptidase subunit
MTCVAYRDGVLAADSLSIVEDVKMVDDIKVARRKGHLFGICGMAMPPLEEAIKWYFNKDKKPLGSYKFSLLVITPEGKVYDIDQKDRVVEVDLPFYAIGSGTAYAFGAMEMGATAIQAVEAAIKWCPSVGGKVIVRKL